MKPVEISENPEKIISKIDVNNLLKSFGNEMIRWKVLDKNVPYKVNDKAMKGISVGSRSPMDVTSAGEERIKRRFNEVREALIKLGLKQESADPNMLFANTGTPKKYKIVLSVQQYPAYHGWEGYDQGYMNVFVVSNFI